ncbi:hypothetical protein B0H63DRAFT_474321 [Podospora didyma]|uniref:SnoaL-like domain-containing protein n=1 Tax=Podospora didyma TaxID=330526 RepID=A0AAE0U078_9PEZI|nr:hypothetical protein B0H63DRAFT_474321 [Podospora didyma]
MATDTQQIIEHLKARYSAYRKILDIDAKGLFFSPNCMQICGPHPTYAAKDGQTIVRYLHEAAAGGIKQVSDDKPRDQKYEGYTIRAIREDELSFETDEVVAHAGTTTAELKQRAKKEGWVGMRVDLWFGDRRETAMLVKVKYWWRKEGDEWVQILHDIMYMGPLDGTEGTEGEVLE